MTEVLTHRGPDASDSYVDGPVAMGFTRLSLVGVEGGGQPLTAFGGDVVLIANGEVYNHRELAAGLADPSVLTTGSDCEVLLHLYRRDGLDFLDRVRGMFSLVLWDRRDGRLIIARDRFGIKPLFFHVHPDRISFASELKALFADPDCPRDLDWDRALADQLITGAPTLADGGLHSWFKQIELAPVATIVSFDLATGDRRDHRYWEFPDFRDQSGDYEQAIVTRYRDALSSAVIDSQTADVEVGLFLSGGIDSAAIAALTTNSPQTFTALNGSTLLNGDAEYGGRIARGLGLINHQVTYPADRFPTTDQWREHLWQLETPLAGPESFYKSELYRYVSAAAPSVKAMMLGGGADEFNGGYTGMLSGDGNWDGFMANLDRMAGRTQQTGRPSMDWARDGEVSLLRTAGARTGGDDAVDPYAQFFRLKYRDVQMYNCWHEDRTAAGCGIEARVPFLDHRLVDIVSEVPGALRSSLIWDKAILRRGMVGTLPDEIVHRPKIPFFYGEGTRITRRAFLRMLRQNDGELLDEAINSPVGRDYLDGTGIRAWLDGLNPDTGEGKLEVLLNLVNLGLLDSMARSWLPTRRWQRSTAVPTSLATHDWDDQRGAIEVEIMASDANIALDEVYEMAQEALVLRSEQHEAACWYLLLNGAIEFVIDEPDSEEWIRILGALDGKRTVRQIGADLHIAEPERYADYLTTVRDAGVITVARKSSTMYDTDQSSAVQTMLADVVPTLAERDLLPIDHVAVMCVGSFARGWANEGSDVDINVVSLAQPDIPGAVRLRVSLEPDDVPTSVLHVDQRRWEVKYWQQSQFDQLVEKVTFQSGQRDAPAVDLLDLEELALERTMSCVPLAGAEWIDSLRSRIADSNLKRVVMSRSMANMDSAVEDAVGQLAAQDVHSAVLSARRAFGHAVDALLESHGCYGSSQPKWRARRMQEAEPTSLPYVRYWAMETMRDLDLDNPHQWVSGVVSFCQSIAMDTEIP